MGVILLRPQCVNVTDAGRICAQEQKLAVIFVCRFPGIMSQQTQMLLSQQSSKYTVLTTKLDMLFSLGWRHMNFIWSQITAHSTAYAHPL